MERQANVELALEAAKFQILQLSSLMGSRPTGGPFRSDAEWFYIIDNSKNLP